MRLRSAREPGTGRPASARIQIELLDIFVLLCCEGWGVGEGCDVARFRFHEGTQLLMKPFDLIEAPREGCDRVGDAQQRQGKRVTLALVRLECLGRPYSHSARQQLRISERVGDPVRSEWMFEITGI